MSESELDAAKRRSEHRLNLLLIQVHCLADISYQINGAINWLSRIWCNPMYQEFGAAWTQCGWQESNSGRRSDDDDEIEWIFLLGSFCCRHEHFSTLFNDDFHASFAHCLLIFIYTINTPLTRRDFTFSSSFCNEISRNIWSTMKNFSAQFPLDLALNHRELHRFQHNATMPVFVINNLFKLTTWIRYKRRKIVK